VRARFLAESGWGEEAAIRGAFEARDRALAAAPHVALWFEHDLYDQLQLLQILSQVEDAQRIELIQADDYLGPLAAAALEGLWELRRALDRETLALARGIWRAVCAGEAASALGLESHALPYVEPALRRLLEERAPLPRTKRQLLTALAHGERTPRTLFMENQAMEDAAFLGDAWCFRFVQELARDGLVRTARGVELPTPPPRGDHEPFASTPLVLTAAGRGAARSAG